MRLDPNRGETLAALHCMPTLRPRLDPAQSNTLRELRKALVGCDLVLDVGCGDRSPLGSFGIKHLVGIEGHRPSFEAAQRGGAYERLVLGDIRSLNSFFREGEFEACAALDVIEHLSKEDGLSLLKAMDKLATKRVVVFTPCGFLPQRHQSADDLQEHLSGWLPEEMERLGFQVRGMLGPKRLRGEHHRLRYRPRVFWAACSLFLQVFWTRRDPSAAAAILCVKAKN
jgi:hypothetical protein